MNELDQELKDRVDKLTFLAGTPHRQAVFTVIDGIHRLHQEEQEHQGFHLFRGGNNDGQPPPPPPDKAKGRSGSGK